MILTRAYPARKHFNNVFDELINSFPATWSNETKATGAPAVNINESADGYNLDFNVPGRNKEDFKINLDNGLLTVSFEKKEQPENAAVTSIRKEFSFNSFTRSFTLDEKISTEGIEAKYENGILSVFLPKKEEVKNAPKQISVQ